MAGSRIENFQSPRMALPGGHYSHAVSAGGWTFISGQLPINSAGEALSSASFEVQVRQVFSNVDAALEAAGTSRDRLVQVRVYVTDIDDWPAFNRLYAEWIGPHRPARAVVPVPALHYGLRLELEGTAFAPGGR